jgi:hypothetical protein
MAVRLASSISPDGVAFAMPVLSDIAFSRPPNLTHCMRMLDRFGMVQFARGAAPDLHFGYCLDDNARAFLAAVMTLYLDPQNTDARKFGDAALTFMEACRRPDGRFHNLMDSNGAFIDEVGSPDSLGRLAWACGVAARTAPVPEWRERARTLLLAALEHVEALHTLHPVSYAILGLAAAVAPEAAAPLPPLESPLTQDDISRLKHVLERHTELLAAALEANSQPGWEWFESMLTWGNARMPEALLRGGAALNDSRLQAAGLRALSFLASVTHEKDVFVPIGNKGWYERDGERAIYDQQPIEACAMVDAWLAAAKLTGQVEYEGKALEAFSWFIGLNTDRLAVLEKESAGCRDGLEPGRLNTNMGAESTLSYVHAHASLASYLRQKN